MWWLSPFTHIYRSLYLFLSLSFVFLESSILSFPHPACPLSLNRYYFIELSRILSFVLRIRTNISVATLAVAYFKSFQPPASTWDLSVQHEHYSQEVLLHGEIVISLLSVLLATNKDSSKLLRRAEDLL